MIVAAAKAVIEAGLAFVRLVREALAVYEIVLLVCIIFTLIRMKLWVPLLSEVPRLWKNSPYTAYPNWDTLELGIVLVLVFFGLCVRTVSARADEEVERAIRLTTEIKAQILDLDPGKKTHRKNKRYMQEWEQAYAEANSSILKAYTDLQNKVNKR